jgi:hypothetical protein
MKWLISYLISVVSLIGNALGAATGLINWGFRNKANPVPFLREAKDRYDAYLAFCAIVGKQVSPSEYITEESWCQSCRTP